MTDTPPLSEPSTWEVFNTKTGIVVSAWPSEEQAHEDKRRRDQKWMQVDPGWILEVREVVLVP